jgi:hypothetical protein
VPIGEAVALVFLATGLLATGRSYREQFWLIAGFFVLGIAGFVLVRDGIRGVVIAGPITGSTMLAALLIGSLSWAQVLGLPRRIAMLLGIGLMSRAIAFNNRLLDHRRRVADAIHLAQQDPPRRTDALDEMTVHVRRVRDLRAPDSAWSLLRDDIAEDDEAWITLLRDGETPERLAEQARVSGPLITRWEQMAAQAAHDQRELATPIRRRRGRAVWLATYGASLLALGLAVGRGYDPFALRLADLDVWLTLVELVGACLLLGGALGTLRFPSIHNAIVWASGPDQRVMSPASYFVPSWAPRRDRAPDRGGCD